MTQNQKEVRTRIAPSPTGYDLHVGSVAVALMNYAWAKKHSGKFIVRIEDTDRKRVVKGAETRILKTLKLIGLSADESPLVGGPFGPYRQSERLEIYHHYAQILIKKNFAYYCICAPERLDKIRKEQLSKKKPPRYDRHCLINQETVTKKIKTGIPYVIRLKVPSNQEIFINDLVRGRIVFKSDDLDDQILIKSDGFPTYHLAVVVDDHLMKINYVIRGEEWLSSTPKHIILYQAFSWSLPFFAHVPLLRNPDRSKLSKRNNPVWVSFYLQQGIIPEALLNYLSLMGWSHPSGKEIFSLEEYVSVFDLRDIQKTAPVFDPVKLEWMSGEYIRKLSSNQIKSMILDFFKNYQNKNLPEPLIEKTIPLIKERIKKLSDYGDYCQFFFSRPKEYELDLSDKKELLKKIFHELKSISDWKSEIISRKMTELAKSNQLNTGEIFMILRVLITGKKVSPPISESLVILGKEESLKRIEACGIS
ncbi:MAG: glutamate--tRNA ligase [Patescibacteria group bacterium]|nr:glutamate--tRNA ligase [Patescibacteria group bacterium]